MFRFAPPLAMATLAVAFFPSLSKSEVLVAPLIDSVERTPSGEIFVFKNAYVLPGPIDSIAIEQIRPSVASKVYTVEEVNTLLKRQSEDYQRRLEQLAGELRALATNQGATLKRLETLEETD